MADSKRRTIILDIENPTQIGYDFVGVRSSLPRDTSSYFFLSSLYTGCGFLLYLFIGACKDPLMAIVTAMLPGMSLRHLTSIYPSKQIRTSLSLELCY
ncbi:hypothetical protein LINPERPRIM_LOCUS31420 [Linum perenne]